MTTTNMYQGYAEAKPTSRVMRPPGGGSSNIFGTEEPQERTSPKKAQTHSNIFGDPAVNMQEDKVGKRRGGPPDNSRDNVFGGSTIEDKTRSENKRRGQEQVTEPRGRSQSVKTKGEEFPAYDPSVYAAHMTPNRRNINRVSNFNPITGETYAGYDDEDKPLRRGKRAQRIVGNSDEGLVNPITGEVSAKEEEKFQSGDGDGTQAYHSSSRVLAPPGGKSSGPLW